MQMASASHKRQHARKLLQHGRLLLQQERLLLQQEQRQQQCAQYRQNLTWSNAHLSSCRERAVCPCWGFGLH